MHLFIAEKPSLANSIAAVLSKPQKNNTLYIKAGDDIVAWAAGNCSSKRKAGIYSTNSNLILILRRQGGSLARSRAVWLHDINLLENKTKTPVRFTEAILLKAMNTVL